MDLEFDIDAVVPDDGKTILHSHRVVAYVWQPIDGENLVPLNSEWAGEFVLLVVDKTHGEAVRQATQSADDMGQLNVKLGIEGFEVVEGFRQPGFNNRRF